MHDIAMKDIMNCLQQQCSALCKKKETHSIWRALQPKELMSFSFHQLISEWKLIAPLLYQFLVAAANATDSDVVSIGSAGAILLRQRNIHMSALHHIIGLVLFHGNASKLVC